MVLTTSDRTTLAADPSDDSQNSLFVRTYVHWVFVTLIAAWTVVGIRVILTDASWGALNIAFLSGPLVNGVLATLGIVFLSLLRAVRRGTLILGPCLTIVASAIISCATFVATLFASDLHGC